MSDDSSDEEVIRGPSVASSSVPSNSESYFKTQLNFLFYSNKSDDQINEAIRTVLEQTPQLNVEERLEEMINLLVESGDSTLHAGSSNGFLAGAGADESEGAVGFSQTMNRSLLNQHYDGFCKIFPDICPDFLMEFTKKYDCFNFDAIVDDLLTSGYAKVEKDPLDVWERLKEMLPDADPIYLRNQARVLVKRPTEDMDRFVQVAIDKSEYPTMKDYLVRKQETDELSVYKNHFTVEAFLERVPNPLETLLKSDKPSVLSEEGGDVDFALNFLHNYFPCLRQREIDKIFQHYNRNVIRTFNRLKVMNKHFRKPRPQMEEGECKNVALLQEVAFLKHEKAIRRSLKLQEDWYREAFEEAKEQGLLQTCGCCFDDQIIPEQCYFCNKNCVFCKDCVRMGVETAIGKGDLVFPCLANCDSEFDLHTIQMVMDRKVFQRLCQKIQAEEIKKANIPGLEVCPFCDFSMIPAEGDKIFKCKNIECMKETCRECKHTSHVPKRCSEIEYDEDVKIRTYIENKMSEAFLRQCWKCKKMFYKDSGCNKMTCSCGAKMCYVCGKPVHNGYTHFGIGGTCPLHTDNLRQFHLQNILEGARAAKMELGVASDPKKLKFDPTRDLENHV